MHNNTEKWLYRALGFFLGMVFMILVLSMAHAEQGYPSVEAAHKAGVSVACRYMLVYGDKPDSDGVYRLKNNPDPMYYEAPACSANSITTILEKR